MLSQGQFLENDGEKSEEIKSKKILSKDTQRVLFHYRDKFPLCDLVQGQAPKPQQQKQKWHSLRSCLLKSKSTR